MTGWIAVDLDGTLAQYDGWVNETHIGEPVPVMAARVREWLANGKDVRIFTARVFDGYVTGGNKARKSADEIRSVIQDWTQKHFGVRLQVTCMKDYGMVELWDDRAVQVIPNTGSRADGLGELKFKRTFRLSPLECSHESARIQCNECGIDSRNAKPHSPEKR